ncbi:MAG: HAD-IA family hydrolase [Pyrinomonadaceae bacterium]|nr:HAD-IA family hydrolase [Pyrinomonadaceae bacterium]
MTISTRTITTLLFDWDGTVVDSAQLGLTAYEKAFAELGILFDHETYRAVYSPNWLSVYEGLGLPKEQWQRADELWTHHYGEQSAELIEGAGETLGQLRQKGLRMGVVSSGNDCRVNREIEEQGLAGVFEVVICHEQISHRKPHPEGLETAMRALGCAQMEVGYVGDTPEDIEMGKGAGVLTVGVRSAYPTSWKLESAQPDILIESLTELADHFFGAVARP